MKNSGVSEILGGLLAVSIVFSGMGIIGVYLISTPPPEPLPQISFLVYCCSDDNSIIISHQGGDSIYRSDIDFKTYQIDGNEATNDWVPSSQSGLFETGDTIEFSSNNPKRLLIIDISGTKKILLDTQFTCFDCP